MVYTNHEITYISDSDDSSEAQNEGGYEPQLKGTVPKIEIMSFDMAPQNMGDNRASSSGSNIRSSFIQMGFSHSLVNKVIEEKGEEDADLILETLFAYSALQNGQSDSSLHNLLTDSKDVINADCLPKEILHKAEPGSSDSLDSLFGDDKDTGCSPVIAGYICPKEELDVVDEVENDKRASLLMMNFSLDQINFAIDKIGEDAAVNELVDFIFAAQIAEKQAEDDANSVNEERTEEATTEILFGTMDKTLRLLDMGFSENQISAAIEKYGSEVSVAELADSICTDAGPSNGKREYDHIFDSFKVKIEDSSSGEPSQYRDLGLEKLKGKRPKEDYSDEFSSFKRPKQEYDEDFNSFTAPAWPEARRGGSIFGSSRTPFPREELSPKVEPMDGFGMPRLSKPLSCRKVDQVIAEPPYFLYGNVLNLTQDCWAKVSQFLYAMEPEFVNAQFFSALSRKEGYVHNLPSKDRFHITPKSPMTIQEAIPHTKRFWPAWDTRKQLSYISTEVSGVSPLCDRLGKNLSQSRRLLSVEQQRDLLHQCTTLNLVWTGHNKLGPMDAEHLERILGYPPQHTRALEFDRRERLHSLKHCFQTDTLGYHLSPLKPLYPGGVTVLSVYTGIGGAEVALHRLGIRLKGVVSVEPCEIKRKVLRNWWRDTEQAGELVLMEDIMKLTSTKLESLFDKFGGFDLIICQNPYTYSSKNPSTMVAAGDLGDVDFTTFYEFVRILQRVRNAAVGRGR